MPKLTSDHTRPVCCPFCGSEVLRPVELEGGTWYDFAGGFCDCGAVFALDPTARNGGAAFLQALVVVADGDMDRAMSLSEGEDYDCGYVQNYDSQPAPAGPQLLWDLVFRAPAGPGRRLIPGRAVPPLLAATGRRG